MMPDGVDGDCFKERKGRSEKRQTERKERKNERTKQLWPWRPSLWPGPQSSGWEGDYKVVPLPTPEAQPAPVHEEGCSGKARKAPPGPLPPEQKRPRKRYRFELGRDMSSPPPPNAIHIICKLEWHTEEHWTPHPVRLLHIPEFCH